MRKYISTVLSCLSLCVVAELTANSLRARSRNDRQRLQDALASRDGTREACIKAALLGGGGGG